MPDIDIGKMHPRNGRLVREDGTTVNEADLLSANASTLDQFGRAMSALNELKVTERTPIFSLSSVYPLSVFRDVVIGDVTHDIDQYVLAPSAILESAELLRYTPGFSAEVGQGVRFDAGAEGEFGAVTDDFSDGFFWRYTVANGLEAVILRDGVEVANVLQADFDDPLDGTGPSGMVYSPTKGYTFQINYTYYGYGPVVFSILRNNGGIEGSRLWPVAVLSYDGGTSTRRPNTSIIQRNTGASGNMYVTGRQASIVGKFLPSQRRTGATSGLVGVGTSWVPLISVRRRNGGSDFREFSFSTDELHVINGTNDIEFQLVLNPVLTGASPFLAPNSAAGETSVEFDISATAASGGNQFFSDILSGSGNKSSRIEDETQSSVRIPRNYWVSLIARTLSGSSSVRAHMRVLEEW